MTRASPFEVDDRPVGQRLAEVGDALHHVPVDAVVDPWAEVRCAGKADHLDAAVAGLLKVGDEGIRERDQHDPVRLQRKRLVDGRLLAGCRALPVRHRHGPSYQLRDLDEAVDQAAVAGVLHVIGQDDDGLARLEHRALSGAIPAGRPAHVRLEGLAIGRDRIICRAGDTGSHADSKDQPADCAGCCPYEATPCDHQVFLPFCQSIRR